MATLNELYYDLYSKVVEDDLRSQEYYLSVVADQRKIPVSYLLDLGALFIPNNEYILHYLGNKVYGSNAGLYYDQVCPWTLFVILPVRNLAGDVMGLVGWDAYNKYKEVVEGEQGLVSYKVSAKSVFPREKYFLTDVNCLREQFEFRTVFVTDGVFDSVALNYRGLPAIALLGSSFSPEILYFLRWYKAIYVCADNDAAGVSLYSRLARAVPHVYRLVQNKTKDIEELLRGDGVDGPITTELKGLLTTQVKQDYIIKNGGNPYERRFHFQRNERP